MGLPRRFAPRNDYFSVSLTLDWVGDRRKTTGDGPPFRLKNKRRLFKKWDKLSDKFRGVCYLLSLSLTT